MKKTALILLTFSLIFGVYGNVSYAGKTEKKEKKVKCTTIQDQILETAEGEIIPLGFIKEGPKEGYNYQARIYKGDYYDNGGKLIMKWNDAWLSNKDCDGDGQLDRHLGFDSYIGSSAWLTNHETWTNEDGSKGSYFVKIVAAPADAYLEDGVWYTNDDVEIGPVIWGQFAIIQEVYNDSSAEEHGLYFKSTFSPGLGVY